MRYVTASKTKVTPGTVFCYIIDERVCDVVRHKTTLMRCTVIAGSMIEALQLIGDGQGGHQVELCQQVGPVCLGIPELVRKHAASTQMDGVQGECR